MNGSSSKIKRKKVEHAEGASEQGDEEDSESEYTDDTDSEYTSDEESSECECEHEADDAGAEAAGGGGMGGNEGGQPHPQFVAGQPTNRPADYKGIEARLKAYEK